MTLRTAALAALLAFAASPAFADGVVDKIMTDADKGRLKNYESVRAEALAEAKAGGAPLEVSQLETMLSEPATSFSDFDMTGDWQCRTTKVGKLAPLVVYGWFKCRVSDDGSGWMLEKLTGSQRTKGRFFTDSDRRLVYLGSGYVAGEKAKPYGKGPETDQVGYAFRTGPSEWRIEMPSPHLESKLDILEFRR
ncbi:MAG TPA: DUF4893 domain-containing protein [Rhizobiaceae bacterium]|nr:DUF4893 domain-containing protein [Rhizobiaceae bacterium]